MNKILASVIVIFALLGLGCSATTTTESTGQYIDSSAITTKIKAQLVDQLGSKALAIQVKTYKDSVQLSGFVNSQTIKNRAGAIAAKNPEVKHVRNDLIVK